MRKTPPKGSHFTDAQRAAISDATKRAMANPEVRAKMSAPRPWRKGKPGPMRGKKHTPEAKARIAASTKESLSDPAVRAQMSISHTGLLLSPETKATLSEIRTGEKNPFFGKKHTPETLEKISKASAGENNPRYIDGRSHDPYCPQWNPELRERIRAFFEYRCVACGMPQCENSRDLNCHHVAYNKQTCCDESIPMFAPLCDHHHGQSGKNRESWQYMLGYIIQEIYNGKSYLPKQ